MKRAPNSPCFLSRLSAALVLVPVVLLCTNCFAQGTRTREEVDELIQKAGTTDPDWWEKVPLKYPDTLDLTRQKTVGGWNAYRNLDQYLISIVQPNPDEWKGAAKLLHHVLEVTQRDRRAQWQTRRDLAHVYADFLGDYARAAYWQRKVGGRAIEDRLKLAYSYVQLGGTAMAEEIMSRYTSDPTPDATLIRLWSMTGKTDKAIELAEAKAATEPDSAYLAAGDAYRREGSFTRAASFYEKAAAAEKGSPNLKKNTQRAKDNLTAVKAAPEVKLAKIKDGTYNASAMGYKAQVYVSVVVKVRRIESVEVTRHNETCFFTSLTAVPQQIVRKQGIKGVDCVSGATITSEAIMNATVSALSRAMK